MQIGMIGLGRMGANMARRLIRTEAAGNHRRQSGWRSYCTAGLHFLNPSLVLNHLVQYEGIVNCPARLLKKA
jgi:hypothetical protein